MQLLIIALIAVAMFATLLAACLQGKRGTVTWKRCRHCSWWFSDGGEVSTAPPTGVLHINYGTCPDCARKKVDLRIRKQQTKERKET